MTNRANAGHDGASRPSNRENAVRNAALGAGDGKSTHIDSDTMKEMSLHEEGEPAIGETQLALQIQTKTNTAIGQITELMAVRPPVGLELLASVSPFVKFSVEMKLDEASIESLRAAQVAHEKELKRAAFNRAFSQVQAVMPTPVKDRHVFYPANKDGGEPTSYMFTSAGNLMGLAKPLLGRVGIVANWYVTFPDDWQSSRQLVVESRLTHELGHVESYFLPAVMICGNIKDPVKAMAGVISYLARYGMEKLLGVASEQDDEVFERVHASGLAGVYDGETGNLHGGGGSAGGTPGTGQSDEWMSDLEAEDLHNRLVLLEYATPGAFKTAMDHLRLSAEPSENAFGLKLTRKRFESLRTKFRDQLENVTADMDAGGTPNYRPAAAARAKEKAASSAGASA